MIMSLLPGGLNPCPPNLNLKRISTVSWSLYIKYNHAEYESPLMWFCTHFCMKPTYGYSRHSADMLVYVSRNNSTDCLEMLDSKEVCSERCLGMQELVIIVNLLQFPLPSKPFEDTKESRCFDLRLQKVGTQCSIFRFDKSPVTKSSQLQVKASSHPLNITFT